MAPAQFIRRDSIQKAETEIMTVGGTMKLFGGIFKPSASKKSAQNANNHT